MARLNLLSVLLVAAAVFISGSDGTTVLPSVSKSAVVSAPVVTKPVVVAQPVVKRVVVPQPVVKRVVVTQPVVKRVVVTQPVMKRVVFTQPVVKRVSFFTKPVVVAPTTVVIRAVPRPVPFVNVKVVKVPTVKTVGTVGTVAATGAVATTAAAVATTDERGAKPATTATALALPATAAGSATPQFATIAAAAEGAKLSTLVAAIKAAGLVDPVSNADTTWTVFAPTDEAFAAALTKLGLTAEKLLADKDTLTKVLQYHVVPSSAALSSSLKDGLEVSTALPGKSLKINVKDGKVSVTGGDVTANVVKADVTAGKSVVHVIDAVLLPK